MASLKKGGVMISKTCSMLKNACVYDCNPFCAFHACSEFNMPFKLMRLFGVFQQAEIIGSVEANPRFHDPVSIFSK